MDSRCGVNESGNLGQLISKIDTLNGGLTVYVPSGDPVSPETPIELIDEEVQTPGCWYFLFVGD